MKSRTIRHSATRWLGSFLFSRVAHRVADLQRWAKMNRLTLVPAVALIVIVVVLVVGAKTGVAENFRPFGILMLLSLPVIAAGELAAFAYDISKRKNRVSTAQFALRMVLHFVGFSIVIGICVVIAHLPNFHQ